MHNLPGAQKELIEDAKKEFADTGKLAIYEPCNCGSQVRHNNGGNYHDIEFLVKDGEKCFHKSDTTCELTEPAEWFEITEEQVNSIIEKNADWL